jgi:predicted kinase
LIDKDDSKDLLVSHPTAMADEDANVAAYNIMYRIAQTQLENGISSILDSPLARVELYHQAANVAPRV